MNDIRLLGARGGAPVTAILFAVSIGLVLTGCGGDSGGFFGSNKGGAQGTVCNPATTGEGCNPSGAPVEGSSRMKCDPATNTWNLIEVCPKGTKCREKVSSTNKALREAVCDGTPVEDVDGGTTNDGENPADIEPQDTGPQGGADKDDPVCKRWLADRADLTEGKWDGDFGKCTIGKLDDKGHKTTLRVLNLYRFLTGLPEVKEDAEFTKKAQACATLMGANDDISHHPPKTWKCWSEDGSEAAENSNLSTAPAVLAIDRYMVDEGAVNKPTMGHRRWILAELLGPVGIGSTNDTPDAKGQASCLWIKGKSKFKYPEGWVGWPPKGKMPIEAMSPHADKGHSSVDATGWTIQSEDIDLSKATVTVKAGVVERKVKVRQLDPGIAVKHAIAFTPQGWKSEAGQTYEVNVEGIDKPFTYFVQMLDCE